MEETLILINFFSMYSLATVFSFYNDFKALLSFSKYSEVTEMI